MAAYAVSTCLRGRFRVLQAAFRFCAGFGFRGVSNFGAVGRTQAVPDDEARRSDRRKALRLAAYSSLIGVAAALVGLVTA